MLKEKLEIARNLRDSRLRWSHNSYNKKLIKTASYTGLFMATNHIIITASIMPK